MKAALPALLTAAVALGAGAQAPALDDLLRRVGVYVADYEKQFSVVVSRERYFQRAASGGETQTRSLLSEVALVAVQGSEWILFRDVYEVDGHEVHDRKDRLSALFLTPPRDAGAQMRRIFEESTRYNIGQVERTINSPTQVLEFLRSSNLSRSTFRLGGQTNVAGQRAQELRFQERGQPRFIRTTDDAAASGRVWVLPASGAVVRSEVRLDTAGGNVQITVHFVRDERLGMLVPSRMLESYVRQRSASGSLDAGGSAVRVEGDATYSDFRRFAVDTRTIVK